MRGLLAVLILGGSVCAGEPPRSPASVEGPYRGFGYEWENNRMGMERVVPAPWTPVVREGSRLRVWGRTYELGGGVLPKQIVSQGEPLFGTAPRMDLTIDGQPVFTGREQPVFTEVSPDRVRYRVERAKPSYRVAAEAVLEYDGLLVVSLLITPQRQAKLNRLAVELPWRSRTALFYSRFVKYDFNRQEVDMNDLFTAFGRLDRPAALPFNPAVWVGNHDVGAEWVCETDEGWNPPRRPEAIVFQPEGAVLRMRVNVVEEPVEVTAPYRFTFALYPTPIKPLPSDWRRVRLLNSMNSAPPLDPARDRMYTMNHRGFSLKYRGLPALSPVESAKSIDGPVRYMPYGSLYGMPARLPGGEWKDYAPFWTHGGPRPGVTNQTWGRPLGLAPKDLSILYVSAQPKSFQDYLIWQWAQARERFGIGGMYWDFGAPARGSHNPLHPGGEWVSRGGQFYSFFAQREILKRFWVYFKSRDPKFLIMLHQNQTPLVASGFCDVVLSGETLNRMFKRPQWTLERAKSDPTTYDPDYSRVPEIFFEVLYSQRRGVISMLLSQVAKWHENLMAADPKRFGALSRVLLARTVLYDVPVSHLRLYPESVDEVVRAQARFESFKESRFIGPWESAPYVEATGAALRTSLYLPPRGGDCLMIVSNLTGSEATGGVRPNAAKLRAAGLDLGGSPEAVDAMSNRPIDPSRLTLGANDFRMILWRAGGGGRSEPRD